MLAEHLSQAHDAASRRADRIDEQVEWIARSFLTGRDRRVLDLCCGPGLYALRLARKGHTCLGVDYSPASIRFATEMAGAERLPCQFTLGDVREVAFGSGFDLALLVFGEFNVFRPRDGELVVRKTRDALVAGGVMAIEAHTEEAIREIGARGLTWYSSAGGLFSERPHLCLREHLWDAASATATIRYFLIDSSTAKVTRFAQTFQSYSRKDYAALLQASGFASVEFAPSLAGPTGAAEPGMEVIIAR
jgi:SAM-dependent methyltransferase